MLTLAVALLLVTGCSKRVGDQGVDIDTPSDIQEPSEPVWLSHLSEDCRLAFDAPGQPIFTNSRGMIGSEQALINKYEFNLFENSYALWCGRVQLPTEIPWDEEQLLSLLKTWGPDEETTTAITFDGTRGFESLVDGPFGLAGDNVVRGFQRGNTFVILAAYEGAGESYMLQFFESLDFDPQPIARE